MVAHIFNLKLRNESFDDAFRKHEAYANPEWINQKKKI